MKQYSFKTVVCSAVIFFLAVFSAGRFAAAEETGSGLAALKEVNAEFHGGWESSYVSEGRYELERGGLYIFGASLEYKGFSAVFDHLGSDKENYSEVNFGVGYGFEFKDFGCSVGYTRLEFTHDETKDNEWGGEISYGGIPFVSATAAYVYSTEAEGSFAELSASVDVPKFFGFVTVSPYALQSFDFGFATDENDGANNFQFGAEITFDILEKVSLVGHLSHSVEQKDIKAERRNDDGVKAAGTWGGLSLAFVL